MKHYAGLDVSLDTTALCVLDVDGEIVCETSVVSHADDIFSTLSPFIETLEGIGLEAGRLSEFLVCGLKTKGLQAILMETRRVHAALSAIPVKTDRKDACGIAHLLRMGWYQPVHLKTPVARDLRLLLSARETLGRRMRDLENSIRGLLRGFGLRFPVGVRGQLCTLVRDLIDGNPVLVEAIAPLLAARGAISEQFTDLDKQVRDCARRDKVCRQLMSVSGVGAVIAMTFRTAIDDPARFKSSKTVGASFGLTPRRYQSGETDRSGSITKAGDANVRCALYQAAHVMMVRTMQWKPLKAWVMRVAARRGAKRAKVALARKLAVIMHRMWVDGTEFKSA